MCEISNCPEQIPNKSLNQNLTLKITKIADLGPIQPNRLRKIRPENNLE